MSMHRLSGCPSCAEPLEEGDRFCGVCGYALSAPAPSRDRTPTLPDPTRSADGGTPAPRAETAGVRAAGRAAGAAPEYPGYGGPVGAAPAWAGTAGGAAAGHASGYPGSGSGSVAGDTPAWPGTPEEGSDAPAARPAEGRTARGVTGDPAPEPGYGGPAGTAYGTGGPGRAGDAAATAGPGTGTAAPGGFGAPADGYSEAPAQQGAQGFGSTPGVPAPGWEGTPATPGAAAGPTPPDSPGSATAAGTPATPAHPATAAGSPGPGSGAASGSPNPPGAPATPGHPVPAPAAGDPYGAAPQGDPYAGAPQGSGGRTCVACRTGYVDTDGYCEHCGHAQPRERDHLEEELCSVAAVSDRGLRHHRNEDSFAVAATALPDGSAATVAIVCDGVSSASRPDDASAAAAGAASEVLLDALPRGAHPVDAMHEAILAAGAAVSALAPQPPGAQNAPACTLVGAVVSGGVLTIGWVGDSRAYWVPDDRGALPRRLTEDDSWAAQMVAAGLMGEAEAYADVRAHAITGWLGADAYDLDPHTASFRPDHAGVVVVCTDGLWNYAESATDMARILPPDAAERPLHCAQVLVGHALDGGGHDNITVAVVPFTAEAPAAEAEQEAESVAEAADRGAPAAVAAGEPHPLA
ncbi:protein phosphatase 2C domain-containing protein [Streptomyces sp. NPDC029216]|uniref:protein phosphatase 2C domain-containing protein n=1 Tax=Streptomyces sp. NPDC029216 TaxID=3154701 RepID=UPI0034062EFA